ncbi:glycoside hydrolase superfamily [Aspergillus ambiguus]|uniref:glycoside hydrolase superfamily n=1 Tax=Aspergillus ambiguus TaxID=176160 RepID=UPI003CCD8AE1
MWMCLIIRLILGILTLSGLSWTQTYPNLSEREKDLAEKNNSSSPITLTVVKDGGNQSSPLLWGIMFEEMDQSGIVVPSLHCPILESTVNYCETTVFKVPILDNINPVSDAITSSLQVQVMPYETKFVGFSNSGYNGIPVVNATYRCEFWILGAYSGPITLQLVGSSSGIVYANKNISVDSFFGEFTRYETYFNSSASPDGNNEWRLLFDGSKADGGSLNFGLPQLFPPTYHSRDNGLREDVAIVLEQIKPSFLRFPGGNNLEGLQINSRWTWNQTIGPVVERPGRQRLDEYLWWCEDMGMAPVLAVWDGKSYGGILSGSDLQPYVEDIMNELEYLLGPPNSTYGSLRAKNGRKEPWVVEYIEIGNEDDFTGGCPTYPDRFTQIYDAIHEKYPNITLIASTNDFKCLPESPPAGIIYDYHYYRKSDDLVAMFNYWDNQPRSQPIMVGEFGCRNTSQSHGVYWSSMKMSCSEAVHMIGLERNSDVVKMAAYAPLLQHFGFTQWSPTLLGFDSNPGSITPSTSFYVQQMFSTSKGNVTLPINSTAEFGPLYWVASSLNDTYYVKVANYGEDSQEVHIKVPDTNSGKLQTLAGPRDGYNIPHNVTIKPVTKNVTAPDGSYTVNMAPWSVAVLSVS